MRSVIGLLCAVTMTGCATVSMVPGEAILETELTADQSALRDASDAYCDGAAHAGWVGPDNGIMNIAAILLNGRQPGDQSRSTYLDRIRAEQLSPDEIAMRVGMDARDAADGLAVVVVEAEAVQASGEAIARADVKSFERALVRAQRARRGFEEALGSLNNTSPATLDVQAEIDRFGAGIDHARRLADSMVASYARVNTTTS